jgi:hypothetical protein
VQLRRAVRQCLFDFKNGRQLFVLDLDQVYSLLRDVVVVSSHRGDAFANEAHAVRGQHRDVLDRAAVELGLNVGCCDHGMHAGQGPGG